MAHFITSDCISCGYCELSCGLNDALSVAQKYKTITPQMTKEITEKLGLLGRCIPLDYSQRDYEVFANFLTALVKKNISKVLYEKKGKYEINQDACIDCGACTVECPVGAIQYRE